MIQVTQVLATIPASGWFGVMGEKEKTRIPVESWVLAKYTYRDGDDDFEQTGWLGVGVWGDGPEFLESFTDFQGYDRWSRD